MSPRSRRTCKLRFEVLEDRTVPALIYNFDASLHTLPEAQGFDRQQDAPRQEPQFIGDAFHQYLQTEVSQQLWKASSQPLNFSSTSYVLEADLRVLSSNYLVIGPGAQRSGYYLWPIDSAGRSFAVGIESGGIRINTDLNFSPINGTQFKPFDTSVFHHYRLVIDAAGGTLFIDGERIASTPLGGSAFSGFSGDSLYKNRVLFGDAAGVGDSETELRSFSFSTAEPNDIHMVSAQLQSGNTVQFTYDTTGNPGAFDVGLYPSADGVNYDPAERIPNVTVPPFTPDPTKTQQQPVTLTLPSPWNPVSGKPFLVVVADPPSAGNPKGSIDESNDTDQPTNNNSASFQLPDIAVTDLAWNTTQGGVNIKYQVNGAALPVDSSLRLYWASSDPATSMALLTAASDPLPIPKTTQVGQSQSIDVLASQFTSPAPKGTKYIVVIADPDKRIDESNEVNNSAPLADLAAQVRDNSRIKFADTHEKHSQDDGATAQDNIDDSANGKLAQRSSYTDGKFKGLGGYVFLDQRILQGMLNLAKDYTFSVSEIAGGVHPGSNGSDSSHYAGLAFDVNYINGDHVSIGNKYFRDFEQEAKDLGATHVLGPEHIAKTGRNAGKHDEKHDVHIDWK